MEFTGFTNSDFDFFRKKASMNKTELDEKREEIKRHFREFCYQIQKNYHATTGGALILDKDFQGLGKGKTHIFASSKFIDTDLFILNIILNQDCININLSCPSDDDPMKFQQFKDIVESKGDVLTKFFKENKSMFLTLYNKNSKKQGEDIWTEVYKFSNTEMGYGDYSLLLANMEKLQPAGMECKMFGGIRIAIQYSKSEVAKVGKILPGKVCTDITRLQDLCGSIR